MMLVNLRIVSGKAEFQRLLGSLSVSPRVDVKTRLISNTIFGFFKKISKQVNMVKRKRDKDGLEEAMEGVNDLKLDVFVERFLKDCKNWTSWTHPKTSTPYNVSITTASALSKADLESCFKLVEFTSSEDYKKLKDGWKPRSKRAEMKLLDLKYFLVKNPEGSVEGFCSFMPTMEDGYAVVYIYEVHLGVRLQGTGLGKVLMAYVETMSARIPSVMKVMLTVFVCNERAVQFYERLGYEKDEFSPPPRILRNGTKVEQEYLILSKVVGTTL